MSTISGRTKMKAATKRMMRCSQVLDAVVCWAVAVCEGRRERGRASNCVISSIDPLAVFRSGFTTARLKKRAMSTMPPHPAHISIAVPVDLVLLGSSASMRSFTTMQ